MRDGLFSDVGYHDLDDAAELGEKYCSRCKNLPLEQDENGDLGALDCPYNCSLFNPRHFEEEE